MNIRLTSSVTLLAVTTANAQTFDWRRASVDHLAWCMLAYDAAGDRLFALSRDLHQWDGDHWVRRVTSHALNPNRWVTSAYDSRRQRLVAIEYLTSRDLNVFEFDGADWTQMATGVVQPPTRAPAAIAFDDSRQMVVIFGGRGANSQAVADTWGWNGVRWIQLATTGPSARGSSAMAFHPPSSRLVLYGGDVGGNETWTFDGSQWTQMAPVTNPPQCTQHCMTTDPTTGTVWMHDGPTHTTWSWNGNDWTQGPSLGQAGRTVFGLAHDGRGLIVAGGMREQGNPGPLGSTLSPTGDMWQLTNGSWFRRIDGGPLQPSAGVCCYDESRGRLVFLDNTINFLTRTWEWTGDHWIDTNRAEPQMAGMASCYHPFLGRVLAFGGNRLGSVVADFRSWDGANWTVIQQLVSPPRRSHAAMAFDPLRSEVVLHGGVDSGRLLADTWAWNGTSWRLAATSGPSPRIRHAMTFDLQNARLLMFGGADSVSTNNETWQWDGFAWTQLNPVTVPPARSGHQLLSSLPRPTPTIIGGYGFIDRWEWTGSDWLQVAGDLPTVPEQQFHSLAAIDNHGDTIYVDEDSTWIGSTGVATIGTAGPGCANGPLLRALGEPVLGNANFAVDLARTPVGSPYLLAAGAGVTSVPIGNCTLHLPAIDLALIGIGTVRLPVPAIASLLGVEFSMQAAALDPASALGFTLSDGLLGRIGR